MKHSFQTISYKSEFIQCDSEEIKWRGKSFVSVFAAKLAITKFSNKARP